MNGFTIVKQINLMNLKDLYKTIRTYTMTEKTNYEYWIEWHLSLIGKEKENGKQEL